MTILAVIILAVVGAVIIGAVAFGLFVLMCEAENKRLLNIQGRGCARPY